MNIAAFLKLIGGVRAAIFAGICLLLAASLGVQTVRLDRRTNQRDVLQAQSAVWEQANQDNVKAIADLRNANGTWASLASKTSKKAEQAEATIDGLREQLAKKQEQSRRERGEIYANDPDAAAWGRARVPARIADQLRK